MFLSNLKYSAHVHFDFVLFLKKYNLDMKVYSECAPLSTERITQMRGKPDDIIKCLQDVLVLLETVCSDLYDMHYKHHVYLLSFFLFSFHIGSTKGHEQTI
jgi:hypothetical protein